MDENRLGLNHDVGYTKRLEDIKNRYGENSITYKNSEKLVSKLKSNVYEDYLIEKKERVNITEKKYIELTDYEKIDIYLQKNDFFDGAEIYKIFNKDSNAEVFLKDGEQEIEFYLYDVDDFTMVYFTDETYIDSITVNKIGEKISLEIDDNGIYISAKRIKLRFLDIDNTIYTYASVKYKENQDKTFYYISNIENLNVGDYVYVPVKESSCPAIVENIETFSFRNVPFPINRTKRIIRRSSKEEYEEYKKGGNYG